MPLSNFEYEIRNGKTLYIFLSGKKTYDLWGKNSNGRCAFSWKLYDNEGYVVDSGDIFTGDLAEGDRFQNYGMIIKNIDLTKKYRLKVFDYNSLD